VAGRPDTSSPKLTCKSRRHELLKLRAKSRECGKEMDYMML